MLQVMLTVSACKRLIARGMVRHPEIQRAISGHTLVIVAGTTNGYIAEEILKYLGYEEVFPRQRFFRGMTVPPWCSLNEMGRLPDESKFPGDVVIVKGNWERGKTIFDVISHLNQNDIVLKGANALDVKNRRAGIFVAHPQGGTIGTIIPAVIGRRVRLIIPVGLEKRIYGNLDDIAIKINTAHGNGPRFFPVPGEVFTEIDAIKLLTGADAELIGGGGVNGAEGALWFAITGTEEQEHRAHELICDIQNEPLFQLD